MTDVSRVEELRRRVLRDPASIAFAQLAEEYRRAGHLEEAIRTCRTGLVHHPGYLSARVTLGRALLESHKTTGAVLEFQRVLRAAPENLAALNGLAEAHLQQGELAEALDHYRQALVLVPQDQELQRAIGEIELRLAPSRIDGSAVVLAELERFLTAVRARQGSAHGAPGDPE